MYDLTFVPDQGNALAMNYENGIIIRHITGATGMTVTTKTAQGYRQVGVSVSAQTVAGRDIIVDGFIFQENAQRKQELIKTFAPFVSGRLYWENRYWIDVVVKDSPTVSQNKHSDFTFRLLAPDPFWRGINKETYVNGDVEKLFSFPINYGDPAVHRFGNKSPTGQFSILNSGEESAPLDITINGTAKITNPCVTNTQTGDFIQWNSDIEVGETLRIYHENGRIRVTLTDIFGVANNAIAYLDDDSSLFSIAVGDNVLSASADSGDTSMAVSISFYPLYSGVLMYGV